MGGAALDVGDEVKVSGIGSQWEEEKEGRLAEMGYVCGQKR
jgi:hypothetical protein